MKKLISVMLLSFSALGAFASNPLNTAAALLPLALFDESMESVTYDLSSSSGMEIVAYAAVLAESDLNPMELSFDFERLIPDLMDAAYIAAALSDMRILAARGRVTIEPEFEKMSVSVIYDDVAIIYSTSGWASYAYIDGRASILLDYTSGSLLTITVTDETNLSGGGSFSISIYLDYDALELYLELSGNPGLDEMRPFIAEMVYYMVPPEMLSLFLGSDVETLSMDGFAERIEELNMTDVLDAVAYILLASEDYYLSETEMISLCFDARLSIDGEVLEDFDIKSLVRKALAFAMFADEF